MSTTPHATEASVLVRELGSDVEAGLGEAEARRRLERDGPNRLPERARPSRLALLGRQLASPLVALLAGAAAVSLAIGEPLDAAIIVAIVVANTLLGYVQEGRAEEAARELRTLLSPTARVVRGGRAREVDAEQLVVGDVVSLRPGDRVPADGRLLRATRLEVDESALTGESFPVAKGTGPPVGPDAPVAERPTMTFASTVVTRGRGGVVVTGTGAGTEIGRTVASAIALRPPPTPLQARIASFSHFVLRAAAVLCVGLAALAWAQGESLEESFLIGVSLAVAAVPEGLPAVMTIALAIGVQRMARHAAVVKRLAAVETLGSTTVVCTDKTGTLTKGRFAVARLYVCESGRELGLDDDGASAKAERLVGYALLASHDEAGGSADAGGLPADPLEAAIAGAARDRGLGGAKLLAGRRVVEIEPFDSERKRMSVVVEGDDGARTSYVKGAPEAVIPRLVDASHEELTEVSRRWAEAGLRVLMVARRELPADGDPEASLAPAGLIAFEDPPRAGTADSVEDARRAGVRTVMITGDHPGTATAIARATSIVDGADHEVVTGPELERMSDEELRRRVPDIDVYARVAPGHKVRIVDALTADGQVVAMTGDGVNDVPALEAAHIGVAMGRRGTDAAKAAADMVLADDEYSTIVRAIRRGRSIYDNVLRFVQFLLAANAGEVTVFALAIALGLSAPLTVVQILVVNLLTDGLPAVALGVDPPERDVMRRPPRPPGEGLLEPISDRLVVGGLATGAAAFASFAIGESSAHALGQTMAFTTLVFAQLAYVFAVRGSEWFFRAGRNPALYGAVVLSAAIQAVILAVPGIAERFDVVPMSPGQLAAALALATIPFLSLEALKAVRRAAGSREAGDSTI